MFWLHSKFVVDCFYSQAVQIPQEYLEKTPIDSSLSQVNRPYNEEQIYNNNSKL